MMRYVALCALLLFPSGGMANEAPPVPEGGLSFYAQFACVDNETGQEGYCYFAKTVEGRDLTMFWQSDVLMFIRETVGGSYITIWVNDQYNSI